MAGESGPRLKFRCGIACACGSAVLLAFIIACFVGLWDWAAAITLFPQWSWAFLGVLSSLAAWRMCQRRWILLLVILWCISAIFFSDNFISLLRLAKAPPPVDEHLRSSNGVRVVTLNCAGSATAVNELPALRPDILLLQEIPSTKELARCALECFGTNGSSIAGFDCAILTSGKIHLSEHDSFPPQFVRVEIELQSGGRILVTSLRLLPPEGRMDLWNPKAWQESTANRRLRRMQLQAALDRLPSEGKLAEIFGGDFNAPVSDSVFRLLAGFKDAHREGGIGWGNTAINSFPIARPDQIWVKGFHVISARAVRTMNSDHRLVVADLEGIE